MNTGEMKNMRCMTDLSFSLHEQASRFFQAHSLTEARPRMRVRSARILRQRYIGGKKGRYSHWLSGASIRPAVCLVLLIAASASSSGQEIETSRLADLAVMNGRIWTGTEGATPPDLGKEPTSLAIVDGRIVAVGDGKEMLKYIGPATRIINASQRRIIPGFTDSHTHIVSGGLQLARLNLRQASDKKAFIAAVEQAARHAKPGEWIVGGRWTVESWTKPESPSRHWLDPVTGDTPVFLFRMDGHQALVNSAALRLAGIDAAGPADPKGGEIVRDPMTKEPTGILKESAMNLVSAHMPTIGVEQRYAALRRAMDYANQLGITSVHDMSDPADLPAFRRAEQDGTVTVRITSYPQHKGWSGPLAQLDTSAFNSDWLRIAGMKGYMDGSLGSRTACMHDPFTDATKDMPYPRGQLTAWADSAAFGTDILALIERGLQPAVHAIGDQANHLLLNAYEQALASSKKSGGPMPRIEHAQHLLDGDVPRFGKIGVIPSMQPYHKADDGRYAEKALGSARLEGSYAFRQLVDTGALLIFGTDWPVVSLEPFLGIDAAVNARTLDGKTWLASHSLSVAEALYAYTVAPTRAVGRQDELGTIEVGKLADLVVLSDDPFTIPTEQLGTIRTMWTLVNGHVVFAAEP